MLQFPLNRSLPRIAIGFFGIPRSLDYTIGSIEKMVFEPARRQGNVRIFSHFWKVGYIDNPRSGERGNIPATLSTLLGADVSLEDKAHDPEVEETKAIFRRGHDIHEDGYRSLDNLASQMHSILRLHRAMETWNPHVYLFLRPDLEYHDTFAALLRTATRFGRSAIFLPDWQHHLGVNDRFAVCRGAEAAQVWAGRVTNVKRFMDEGHSMNGERFLEWHLDSKAARISYHSVRASRVRLGGILMNEDFASSVQLKRKIRRLERRARVRSNVAAILPDQIRRQLKQYIIR